MSKGQCTYCERLLEMERICFSTQDLADFFSGKGEGSHTHPKFKNSMFQVFLDLLID